ncbi:MAG: hypothetical protein P1V81_16665 [Planctomycetota bacterium]|nr:hypothetical protein [Planctomycetota bacterium]
MLLLFGTGCRSAGGVIEGELARYSYTGDLPLPEVELCIGQVEGQLSQWGYTKQEVDSILIESGLMLGTRATYSHSTSGGHVRISEDVDRWEIQLAHELSHILTYNATEGVIPILVEGLATMTSIASCRSYSELFAMGAAFAGLAFPEVRLTVYSPGVSEGALYWPPARSLGVRLTPNRDIDPDRVASVLAMSNADILALSGSQTASAYSVGLVSALLLQREERSPGDLQVASALAGAVEEIMSRTGFSDPVRLQEHQRHFLLNSAVAYALSSGSFSRPLERLASEFGGVENIEWDQVRVVVEVLDLGMGFSSERTEIPSRLLGKVLGDEDFGEVLWGATSSLLLQEIAEH